MNSNKQNLISKIKYRSQYRGTKEMDLFINKFVNSVIQDLNLNQLRKLSNLVKLKVRDRVNIEFDIIGKYLKNFKKNEN